jgi:hypothetical protein
MLGSACIVGGAAGEWNAGALAAIIVAFMLFMLREPLYVTLNRRNAWLQLVITLTIMCFSGIYLLLYQPLGWVAASAIFAGASTYWHMRLRLQRKERSMASEVLGIAQLTSATPLVYVFGGGFITQRALLLWLLLFAYYAGSIFYVKMRVSQVKQKPKDLSELVVFGKANTMYQALLVILLIILVGAGKMPGWAALGYAPNIVKSLLHVLFPLRNLSLKRIGVVEMGYAGLFTAVLAAWAAAGL